MSSNPRNALTQPAMPPGRLPVLVLLERRLDRDAYAALVESDPRLKALAAPNVPAAGRALSGQDTAHYALLVEPPFADDVQKRLLAVAPPQVVVVLDSKPQPQPRRRTAYSQHAVCRDTPWCEVLRLLLWGHPDAGAAGLVAASNGVGPPPPTPVKLATLTRRERQVLELVATGASVRECAASLHIAESTVDNHKSRLMRKLGVRKSAELVRFAFQSGLMR